MVAVVTIGTAPSASPQPESAEARRSFKADQVYATLKEEILSGKLTPGSAIDKPELCDRLGMSRFPVSTAINRLAFEKLVVIEPQHGSFVSRISLRDVREFMLIRGAIEGDLVAEAAKLGSAALDADLARNLEGQAEAVASPPRFYELDVMFHHIIVQALGLPHAADVLDQVLSHLERVRRLLTTPPGRSQHTLAEHRAIAEAIAARNPDGARAAARAHLAQTSALFESFARQHPLLFAESNHA